MERRGKGEGTFEKLKSGSWSCYLRKGNKKVRGTPGATKAEASRNLQFRIDEDAKGARRASGSSLTTLARKWVEEARLSPSTRDVYGWWVDDLERDPLGSISAKKITESDLQSWKFRASVKWANATLRNRCLWLNQMLAYSGSKLRVAVPMKKDHRRRPMSPDERKAFDALTPEEPWMQDAKELIRLTGGRRSEAFGLRHEDRDGDGVWINRVVLLTKGKLVIRDVPKTAKSHRWIALPAALRDKIGGGRAGYVVGGAKDPMNPGLFSHWLYKAKQGTALANVPYMGAHAVRRTFGMQLLESGADLITAAELMGHDAEMLANEYARSRQDLKTKAIDKAFG